jgi:hypothetical protein
MDVMMQRRLATRGKMLRIRAALDSRHPDHHA